MTEEELVYRYPLKGIKYISFYGSIGYFIAAKRYMVGLKNFGVPVTWTPLVTGTDAKFGPFAGRTIGDQELDPFCNKPIEYDTVIVHTPPEHYPYWIEKEKGKRIIGCTVWETDKLPSHWPMLLNLVDHVIVPCQWNKEVFKKCGVCKPIDVIPHIFDNSSNHLSGESGNHKLPYDINSSDFVFYTIETWTSRKAVWNTIQCYLNTFTEDDPVLLIVKTTKKAYGDSWTGKSKTAIKIKEALGIYRKAATLIRLAALIRLIRSKRDSSDVLRSIQSNHSSPAKIMLITDNLTDKEILELHHRGDCYISLCRSEGWGLGPFTAAGHSKPVIITGFGGHLDFLPKESAYLVDYDPVSVRDDSDRKRFTEDQSWAEPRKLHACSLMRHVFENQKEAKTRGEALSMYINEHFVEDKIMPRLINILKGGEISK